MRTLLTYFVAILFIFPGCQENNELPILRLQSYDARYMFYPVGIFPGNPPVVQIEFDGKGRILKRSGGFLPTSSSSGYSWKFVTAIYDTVMWGNSDAYILRKETASDWDFREPYQKKIYFKGKKISLIVIPPVIPDGSEYFYTDSTHFTYDRSGLLLQTHRRIWSVYTEESNKFFPNGLRQDFLREEIKDYHFESGNLVRIDGISKNRHDDYQTTSIETFKNYDHARNPTASMGILDELFYRSLSRNNFSRYQLEQKRPDGLVEKTIFLEWTLNYDENGVPTFQ